MLMVASVLRRMDRSAQLDFGGELFRGDERENFAELDLFWLLGDHLVPVECKAYNRVEAEHILEIEESLRSTIAVAADLRAPVALLGLLTTEHDPELFTQLGSLATQAAEDGIGVHMILNGQFYPGCTPDPVAPDQVDVTRMTEGGDIMPEDEDIYVGELAPGYGVGSLSGPVDSGTLEVWEAEMV